MSDRSRRIVQFYDSRLDGKLSKEFYGESDFLNHGYWKSDTKTPKEACENLLEELLRFLPEKSGSILDVGCGKGATAGYISQYFGPENVTGINFSEEQVAICRRNAPECTFHVMDAAKLEFPDESFDNIISVEAAFLFDTREDFINEAFRVLKPGGTILVADLLLPRGGRWQPPANRVKDISEYQALYGRAGFKNITVVDASEECVKRYFEYCSTFVEDKLKTRDVRPGLRWLLMAAKWRNERMQTYVLLSAKKN